MALLASAIPARRHRPLRAFYRYIMEDASSSEDLQSGRSTSGSPSLPGVPSIPIPTVSMVNENWRGKNDPAERRRIQNRLNQRAFRQRQRAGDASKPYRPRSNSGSSSRRPGLQVRGESASEAERRASLPAPTEPPRASSAPARESSSAPVNQQQAQLWDELGQLINRNLMTAVATNIRRLGIDLPLLDTMLPGTTPRLSPAAAARLPASLVPVDLQYQLPHDLVVDAIPHARLRHNILAAGVAAELGECLRASGALAPRHVAWLRRGVVVWAAPEDPAAWEMSEEFVQRWPALLRGCDDFLATTNQWRVSRGERALVLPLVAEAERLVTPSFSPLPPPATAGPPWSTLPPQTHPPPPPPPSAGPSGSKGR